MQEFAGPWSANSWSLITCTVQESRVSCFVNSLKNVSDFGALIQLSCRPKAASKASAESIGWQLTPHSPKHTWQLRRSTRQLKVGISWRAFRQPISSEDLEARALLEEAPWHPWLHQCLPDKAFSQQTTLSKSLGSVCDESKRVALKGGAHVSEAGGVFTVPDVKRGNRRYTSL